MTIAAHRDDTLGLSLLSVDLREADSHPGRHATPAPRTSGERARRAVAVVATALVLLLAGAAAVFAATGGHWFVVRTPSMGTTAPVGTLVLTRPVTVADLHVGDIVAFHPTDTPQLTYTHRVVALADGVVTTRGDINGSNDPWSTTDRQLIGRATVVLPGIGFLGRALPLLAVGGLLVVGLTRWWLRPGRRGPARLIGFTLLYAAAAIVVRPFVALRQLATSQQVGSASITASSTGILPIKVEALAGHGTATPVHLRYGEVGTIHFTGAAADDKYALMAQVDLSLVGWIVLGAIWLLPLVWVLVVGFRAPELPAFEAGLPAPTGRFA